MNRLVVALGNPGPEHELTKHNIGWLAVDQLSFHSELRWNSKYRGHFTTYQSKLGKVFILKPMTFMNLSGESVREVVNFFKIPMGDILVVHDELDMDFGKVAFKKGGGLAGHNGLKSIAKSLGSQDFLRLRLGIDRPPHGNVSSWVLSKFTSNQDKNLEDFLIYSAGAIEEFMSQGFQKAAGKFSNKMAF
ncbi:MAG: aminoacyl-tRNA hydrolase [Bacteriovoracaceae bacterium]|jgi:peptidyl-tRNA hydrolase, PTH1 family|nr:aminoacyl-tRNA hydrolase [Bacteriovoracaceae bacterium]